MVKRSSLLLGLPWVACAAAFVPPPPSSGLVVPHRPLPLASTTIDVDAGSQPVPAKPEAESREEIKQTLFERLGLASKQDEVLACPVSLRPLASRTRLAGPFYEIRYKVCEGFGTTYPDNGVYTDLVPNDERKSKPFWQVTAREAATQELFRSPLTSFLYERGWRQNFRTAGFPGVDKEFELLSAFFEDVAGGVIVDMSCGSGLMTRRIVKSRKWSRVIGADYSESMLRETRRRFIAERTEPPELVRADAARMPFQIQSLDAMHAGAALHCWPRLEESLREVYRVLKPGGRFFATTFEVSAAFARAQRGNQSFRFFTVDELRGLLALTGFDDSRVQVEKVGAACLIVRAIK